MSRLEAIMYDRALDGANGLMPFNPRRRRLFFSAMIAFFSSSSASMHSSLYNSISSFDV